MIESFASVSDMKRASTNTDGFPHKRKGGGHTNDFIQNLKDAGCEPNTIADIYRLYENDRIGDAVKALRRHRCILMNDLHKSQEKIDCLDFLVRRMEKERKDGFIK